MWPLAVTAVAVVAATVAAAFPPEVGRALETSSYLYVATRRADGTPSTVVPVWFSWDGAAITFTTSPTSHKARRIGKDGPHFEARAELVRDPELAARMGEAYRRKYWVAWLGFFCPSAERLRAGKIVIVRIRPPA